MRTEVGRLANKLAPTSRHRKCFMDGAEVHGVGVRLADDLSRSGSNMMYAAFLSGPGWLIMSVVRSAQFLCLVWVLWTADTLRDHFWMFVLPAILDKPRALGSR